MKKLLTFLLLFTILFPAALAVKPIAPRSATASPVPSQDDTVQNTDDFTSYSFDELISLRQQIDKALLASDNWTEAIIPQGDYIVGKDIPAGDWSITLGVDDPDAFGEIKVIKDEQTHDENPYLGLLKDEVLQPGNTLNLKLKDGNYVSFVWCPMRIRPYTGAISFIE